MKKIIVLYHDKCMDGSASAWVFWKKYGDSAEYVAVSDRINLPTIFLDIEIKKEDKKSVDIFIVDFCYKKEVLQKLESEYKSLTVLDHHVSAKQDIESVKNHTYGTDKSGAYLAWEYIFPDTEIPKIIKYVSDGDLWQHKMENYKEVLSYIHSPSLENIFIRLDKINYDLENRFDYVKNIGEIINDSHKARVSYLLNNKIKINFAGYDVYAVNGSREMRSEVGHELAKLSGTFGVYYYIDETGLKISLRSMPDFDVSKIAEKFGGGGHKNAAAIDKKDFDIENLFSDFK
jgi:nanoRNase/pAp phosphatase (c-di-AMP/oligoRNAs hydrolase)